MLAFRSYSSEWFFFFDTVKLFGPVLTYNLEPATPTPTQPSEDEFHKYERSRHVWTRSRLRRRNTRLELENLIVILIIRIHVILIILASSVFFHSIPFICASIEMSKSMNSSTMIISDAPTISNQSLDIIRHEQKVTESPLELY